MYLQDKDEPAKEGRLPDAEQGQYDCIFVTYFVKLVLRLCTLYIIYHMSSFCLNTIKHIKQTYKSVQFYFTGADHLREVFVKTMGLSDKDIVVLSGGHTLV